MRPPSLRALFAVAALSGCVTHPVAVPPDLARPPFRKASAEEVRAAWDSWASGLAALSASGRLTVTDLRAGKAREVGVRLVARRGGRLYLKASVAVVTALELVTDGESFWFSLPSKKTVWTGPARSRRTAEEVADADAPYRALRPRDLTDALLPEPLDPAPGETIAFEASPGSFTLTVLGGSPPRPRRRVRLDRRTLEPRAQWSFDEEGELESEARFSALAQGVPRAVGVRREAEGYEAAFAFDQATPNGAVPERAFTPRLPPEYAIKRVD